MLCCQPRRRKPPREGFREPLPQETAALSAAHGPVLRQQRSQETAPTRVAGSGVGGDAGLGACQSSLMESATSGPAVHLAAYGLQPDNSAQNVDWSHSFACANQSGADMGAVAAAAT